MTEFEPLVDRALQLSLAAGEQVAHGFDAQPGFRLQPRKLDHLLVGCTPVALAQPVHGEDADGAGQERRQEKEAAEKKGLVDHPRHPSAIRPLEQKGNAN